MKMFRILLLLVCLHACSYAKKPECKRSNRGFDYQGTLNVTRSGRTCQSWSSQTPHAHNFTEPYYFPDASLEDVGNACRNPDEYWSSRRGKQRLDQKDLKDVPSFSLWCFTTDPDRRIEACDVPFCSDHQECIHTEAGFDYQGEVFTTESGAICSVWDEVGHRYCRNFPEYPDRERPWCYTDVSEDQWEYCVIPFCKPSMNCIRTPEGTEYTGTISATQTERICQRWDTQSPHKHNFTEPTLFPDATLEDASNFCRNPSADPGGPWCFTTDPEMRTQTCAIPICRDCKTSEAGREYSGTFSTSISGYTCQTWSETAGINHNWTESERYPDANIAAAKNFCRNPDGSQNGPWCYVEAPFVEWEPCEIPYCQDTSEQVQRPPLAKHILHIGIDGLRPDCMVNAFNGLPNIIGRLAEHGTYTLTKGRTIAWSFSAPGWSTQLCGMSPEKTGVDSNEWIPNWIGGNNKITSIMGGLTRFPCMFQQIKSQDVTVRTASFYDWPWIETMSSKGYPGMVDKEIKFPWHSHHIWEAIEARDVADYLEGVIASAERSYTFVYMANVDGTGHTHGWCTDEYLKAVDSVDSQVGIMLDVLDRMNATEDVMVVLGTDHGGHDFTHGDPIDEDMIIPLILRGPGIKQNHTFNYEISNQDVAPTVMWALGLKPSNWWTGKVLWEAFESLNP